jgi:molybdopterin converting factor small subunit
VRAHYVDRAADLGIWGTAAAYGTTLVEALGLPALLLAVGVEYQPRSYVLKDGDEVSLFPPVQGG